jgi:dinuclear metal center YbgI/SA1388 family protein
MSTLSLDAVMAYLDRLFEFKRWQAVDGNASGLQVARNAGPVAHVAFAVDASLAAIEAAGTAGAQMLVVHHGLLWGKELPLTGVHYRRVRRLCELDLALVGIHLPLDAHPEVGNNVGVMRALGIAEPQPFAVYKGQIIGCKGTLPTPLPLAEVARLVCGPDRPLGLCDHRHAPVRSIGVVTGGAPYEARQAAAEGLDCYITGDASHSVVHEAAEAGLDLLFGGHYRTETHGVRQLSERLARDTGLRTTLIDLPTGL